MDESKIPEGIYCYDENGLCPYWSKALDKPHQENGFCAFLNIGDCQPLLANRLCLENGFCAFLNIGDWQEEAGFALLWDQVKLCGINETWNNIDIERLE